MTGHNGAIMTLPRFGSSAATRRIACITALARNAGPSTFVLRSTRPMKKRSAPLTSLRTSPRNRKCGAVDVELGLAKSAFAHGGTRICYDFLNDCSDGDVCVDWLA